MVKLNHSNIGDVLKYEYLEGIIGEVDSTEDTASVTLIDSGRLVKDIPLFYHCETSSALKDNGALEGAASAFSEDDAVIVRCEILDGVSFRVDKVMGFMDKPKKCAWEPWTGPDIISYHPWETNITDNCILELRPGGLYSYVEKVWPVSRTLVYINSIPLPQPTETNMKLKILTNLWGGTLSNITVQLKITGSSGGVYLTIAHAGEGTPSNFIGDNGGEEQIIDLTLYGITAPITGVLMELSTHQNWLGEYTWRYIHFC